MRLAVLPSTSSLFRWASLWEVGLLYRHGGAQLSLRLPMEQDLAPCLPRANGR